MNRIKRFFGLSKAAIALLAMLALTSTIGTIIPQNNPAQVYIDHYGENLYHLFKLFSLVDLYHCWWFVGLLILLGLNLIACSWNRFFSTWRLITRPGIDVDDNYISGLRPKEEIVCQGSIDEIRQSLIDKFQQSFTLFVSPNVHTFLISV